MDIFDTIGTIVRNMMIISTIMTIYTIVTLAFIFKKAGEPAWAAIIPIYNLITMARIATGKPILLLLLLIPFVGIVYAIWLYAALFASFQLPKGLAILLAILLNPVGMGIIAFGPNHNYIGPCDFSLDPSYEE